MSALDVVGPEERGPARRGGDQARTAEGGAVSEPTLRSSPPAATPPAPGGTLRDACAACRTPLRVHETTWRTATTAWGFWARANLCGAAECAAIWWETPPEVIADELRDRLLQAGERGER